MSIPKVSVTVLFESCVGSYEEAKKAFKNKTNRIELCDNLKVGGTTPSIGCIQFTQRNIGCHIPINVIIRPRGGNFVYTNDEIEIMKINILECKKLKINGIVTGVLTKEDEIDVNKMKELISISKPLSITFHMAFDQIRNKFLALKILHKLGVKRVLTRGAVSGSALEHKKVIKELIEYVKNNLNSEIIIMPGGGVTKDNYKILQKFSGATEFHGTKIV